MKFKPTEFQNMYFKVYNRTMVNFENTDIINGFSKLDKKYRDPLIRYFCYMYDYGSPFPKKIVNIDERKRECAALAGFDLTSLDDCNFLDPIFRLNRDLYRTIVRDMLMAQKHNDFSRLCALEKHFGEVLLHMLKPIDDDGLDEKKVVEVMKIKDTFRKSMDSTGAEIELLRSQIFIQGDNEQNQIADEIMLAMTPENVAKLLSY